MSTTNDLNQVYKVLKQLYQAYYRYDHKTDEQFEAMSNTAKILSAFRQRCESSEKPHVEL